MIERWIGLGLVLSTIASVAAAEDTKNAATAGTEAALEEKISVDLDAAPSADFLRSLEKLTGCRFVLSNPRRLGPVTLRVSNVRIRTILDAICDGLGCTWSVDKNARPVAIYIEPRASGAAPAGPAARPVTEPIELQVEDASVRDLLHTVAKLMNVREDIAADVTGNITIEVHHTPVSQVLDKICEQAHCVWSIDRSAGKESVLRVRAAAAR